MKRISEFIIEKLKVSTNDASFDITLEKLIDSFKRFDKRNNSNQVDLSSVLSEYPKVLDYTGNKTKENIIGKDILRLGCLYDYIEHRKYIIFIYVELRFGSLINEKRIDIENNEELYEIFGEDVLRKIYDFLEHYEKN